MSEKEVLSEDEVSALTQPDSQDIPIHEPIVNADGYTTIDFSNQEKIVRSHFPVLGRLHERLAKKLEILFYEFFSRDVSVGCTEIKMKKFSECILSLNFPSAINIIRYNPMRGKTFLSFDSKLSYLFVENYFGGKGVRQASIEEREFTKTEQRVLQSISRTILKDVEAVWNPILDIKTELIGFEMNPQMVNMYSSEDVMILTSFEVLFESEKGHLFIIIPYMMLDPFREQLDIGLSRNDDDIDPNWINSLKDEILGCPLVLSSLLTETTMTLNEIISLKAGDFIPMELPDEVKLNIEGIPTFYAKYGVSNDKCALKVTRKIRGKND